MKDGSDLLRTKATSEPDDSDAPDHLGGGRKRGHIDPGAYRFLRERFTINSMLDIGCGLGCMVEYARNDGIVARGVDGDTYGKPDILWDFTHGPCPSLDDVDLVWSMEFLEHVDEKLLHNYMPAFQMGKVVMATFAPPGKAGHHHVNCQDQPYWEDVFAQCGFKFERDLTAGLRKASRMESVLWDGRLRDSSFKRFVTDHGMVFTR